jgi:subtilisin-like proprotein convertase family protein
VGRLGVLGVASSALFLYGCGGDDDGGDIDAMPTVMADAMPPPGDALIPDGPPDPHMPDAGPDASPDAGPDAMLGPETCDNTIDDNGDGKIDCDDPLCATSFFQCQAPACADGQQRVFYHASDLPKLIHGGQTTSSTIPVPPGGAVINAAVKVAIGHNYITDIIVHLTSPENTTIDLTSHNGSVGHNYRNTVFSDSGMTSIVNGVAPFTGVYRPEQPFTAFNGQASGGAWKMDVIESFLDNNPMLDDGGFASYDLMLCVCTNCEVGPNCSDGVDNDTDGVTDCADTDCAANLRCIPETACSDGVDNDLDGHADCSDDQCNGHSNCEFAHEVSCHDNLDNDADGHADCTDSDCSGLPLCLIETNCSDGVDNDMDGLADCQDPGCFSMSPGCQTTETTCDDGIDNDGDGLVDCADPSCQVGVTCAVTACPAGSMPLMLTSTNVPVAIPDSSITGATSTINVTQTGTVNRVIVTMSITHTFDGDLSTELIAPGLTSPGVFLANREGSSGDNFTDTIFSDSAGTPINDFNQVPPYTGPFKPDGMLSTLVGRPLAGAWVLRAEDHAAADTGSITKFQLFICYTP